MSPFQTLYGRPIPENNRYIAGDSTEIKPCSNTLDFVHFWKIISARLNNGWLALQIHTGLTNNSMLAIWYTKLSTETGSNSYLQETQQKVLWAFQNLRKSWFRRLSTRCISSSPGVPCISTSSIARKPHSNTISRFLLRHSRWRARGRACSLGDDNWYEPRAQSNKPSWRQPAHATQKEQEVACSTVRLESKPRSHLATFN